MSPSLLVPPIPFPPPPSLASTGPGGWNDADFIYIGGQGCSDDKPLIHCPGQTDTEYRTEFSMWCIIGSSLIVATDIRNMTDIMKEVKTLISVAAVFFLFCSPCMYVYVGIIEQGTD